MRTSTSRKRAFVIALVPLAGLAACMAGSPPAAEEIAVAASALTSADTCPGTRWIGHLDQSGACPLPTSNAWTPQKLFAGAGATIPAGLDRYCLYELNHAGLPTAGDLGTLPGYGAKTAAQWLDADCMVVSALGDTATVVSAITPELDQSFANALEAPTSMPFSDGPAVRVAIVDSWPDPALVGNLDHGFGMAGIVQRLACGPGAGPSCFAKPVPHLALNLLAPGVRDNVDGGFFGFQGRLAWSIVEAVQAWQSAAPNDRLVMNLSVGWDAQCNLNAAGAVSQVVNATREALEYAACEGALVIAAAGNADTGPSAATGPMYPAAWNEIPAPSCAGPATRPLVYAVAGVDGLDRPLANARPGGRAVLNAPAFQVPGVMSAGGVTVIAGPFTGSSVAAAATSAVAAAVWHQDGSLTVQEVMQIVRTSAVTGPAPANFCFLGAPCAPIRRVSLCRALEAASGTALSCPRHGWGAGLNPIWSPGDAALVGSLSASTPLFDGRGLTVPSTPAGCSTPLFSLGSTTRIPAFPVVYNPCPSDTLCNEVVAPAVCPQPGNDPCPACRYVLRTYDSILEMSISERLSGLVFPQVLSLSDGLGVVVERYDLARATDATGAYLADGMVPGGVYRVLMPAPTMSYGSGFKAASIEWKDLAGTTTTSELIVQ